MKHIQWFPGHMTKAMRMMEEQVKLVDGVLAVLDARAPAATRNKKLDTLFGAKPVLYILNKSDLADDKRTDAFLAEFSKAGLTAVKCSANAAGAAKQLSARISALVREKFERDEKKGIVRPPKLMIAGVPNTGKSTVINALSGEKRAVTGDKAGVTRGKQWIRLEGFELLDTPGTMPPAFENQTFARRLAYVGSINDDILDFDDLALALLADMAQKYPDRLKARYGIADLSSPPAMLEGICVRRGLVLRGGGYDYERACRAVIDDLRKGRLGRVDLDDREDVLNTDF